MDIGLCDQILERYILGAGFSLCGQTRPVVVDDTHAEGLCSKGDLLVVHGSSDSGLRKDHRYGIAQEKGTYSPNATHPDDAENLLVGIMTQGEVASPLAGSNTSEGLVGLSQRPDHEEDGDVGCGVVHCAGSAGDLDALGLFSHPVSYSLQARAAQKD